MTAELTLRGFSGVPEIKPDAIELKHKTVTASKKVKQVTTELEQQTAVEALRQLKAIRTGMEASRKAVKAPVLNLGKQIDSIAADYLQEVDREETRLTGMVNHYQRKQLDEKRVAEAAAQKTEQTADGLREQAIKLRLDGKPNEAAKFEEQALELSLEAELTGPQSLALTKPKGLVVKKRINFQVIDPVLFLQGYPEFWKTGANGEHENEVLKLDRMKVLDELNAPDGKGLFHRARYPEELPASENELVKPPGLRVFEDLKSHVR